MEKVVKSVKYDKPINSQWGEFHKWLLEFEDGFRGEYLSKTETQNKFVEGQNAEIEVTQREYNGTKINKIKPASTFQQGGAKSFSQVPKDNKTQEYIVKQNALTNACNIVGTDDVAKILEIADAFKEWVLNDVKPKNDSNGKDLPF
jgi:hypothetical protein|tara:strand:+ start:454 stop:891 length:438 start_codon:yes stop_codon:yes gene_type:complete